jgi:hypothetical protein
MPEIADPLVLDFVEWIAREPRSYAEVVATWRTSCPRLTIWEDAADRGYVTRETIAGAGLIVAVTEAGEKITARAWPLERTATRPRSGLYRAAIAAPIRRSEPRYLAGSARRGRMISTMKSAEVPGSSLSSKPPAGRRHHFRASSDGCH